MAQTTKIWGIRNDLDRLEKYLKAQGIKRQKDETLRASHDPLVYCLIYEISKQFTKCIKHWLSVKHKQMITRESFGIKITIKANLSATQIDKALHSSHGYNLEKAKRKKAAIKIKPLRKALPPAIEPLRQKPKRKQKGVATASEIIGKRQPPAAGAKLIPLSNGTFEVASEHEEPEELHIAVAPAGAKPYTFAEPTPAKLTSHNPVLRKKSKMRCPQCGALLNKKNLSRHMQKVHHIIQQTSKHF